MKQGTGNSSMRGGKTDPEPNAVSPAAVSEIGVHQVHNGSGPQMYQGRGLEAPMAGCTTHEHGSQGKHK
jgi:hypothetical protein